MYVWITLINKLYITPLDRNQVSDQQIRFET